MYAEINGVKIYYETAGEGEQVIMTFHGGPGIGDGDDNKGMFKSFHDDYRLIYFDQRGNGRSDDAIDSSYTHEQIIDDADCLRDYLGVDKMVISGGSYGGILGMEYALKYPDRVTKMILRGTAASNELQQYAFENALKADLPGINEKMLQNLFYGHMKSDEDLKEHFALIYPLYSKKHDLEKARKLFERKKFRHRTHNAFFRHAFPQYDIRDRLKDISVPTLILVGRHDWITPLHFAEELARGIPRAKLEIFEEAGHSINADMPDKFHDVVRKFLIEGIHGSQ